MSYWERFQTLIERLSQTASGNLRISVQESDIKQPIDIQDHWVESVILSGSSAKTSNGSTSDIDVGRFQYGVFCIDVTAVSGTSPSLAVYIDGKDQYSGKYKVLYQQTGINGVTTIFSETLTIPFKFIRVRWEISGTSPSFTFSVSAEMKS